MKKQVFCPRCQSRIFDAEDGVHTELKVVNPEGANPLQSSWRPDFYIKCWKCKTEVALRKIS